MRLRTLAAPRAVCVMTRYLLLALVAGAASAQDRSPYEPLAGDLEVGVGSVEHVDVGVRYWLADGVSVGVSWDESAFERDDPAGAFDWFTPFTNANAEAWTASATLEGGGSVWRDRLFFSSGFRVFARRQTDDVVLEFDADFDPVLEADGRRVDALGAGYVQRVSFRLVGPVHVGAEGGLSLERVRTRGGTVLDDGRRVFLEGGDRTRWRLGGPGRLYVSVRL